MYKKGFDLYRYRYHRDSLSKNSSLISEKNLLTKETNIKDKSIFIDREQGFGDVIQFIRFLPILKKQEPKKILIRVNEV